MPIPRKVLIRVVGAPLLVAALCALLYWGHTFEKRGRPNYPLYGLLLVVGLIASAEFEAMGKARGIPVQGRLIRTGLIVLFLLWGKSEYRNLPPHPELTFAAAVFILFLALAVDLVFFYGRFPPEAAGLTLFGFCYLSLLGFMLFPPVPRPQATLYLLFLLAAGKGSDMAAYAVGKTLGRHKMTPVVSPNKTWEGGIAGGIVGTGAGLAILLATPLRSGYPGVPVAALLFLALAVTIAAQVGDLVKSAFKRWAGVKDSGRILPEFGGMLDMVDSFIIAAPVATLGTKVLDRFF